MESVQKVAKWSSDAKCLIFSILCHSMPFKRYAKSWRLTTFWGICTWRSCAVRPGPRSIKMLDWWCLGVLVLHFVWQIVLLFARLWLWYNITYSYLWNLDEFYRSICLSINLFIYLPTYLSIYPSKIQPAIFLGAKVGATDVEAMKKIRGALPDPRRRETEKRNRETWSSQVLW